MRKPLVAHVLNFLVLVPFLIMFWFHERIGFSDARLMGSSPWDRKSADYNLVMVGVLYVGVVAFLGLAFHLYYKGRSRGWLGAKVLTLVAYLVTIFGFLPLRRR
jgi:hypothetical protein